MNLRLSSAATRSPASIVTSPSTSNVRVVVALVVVETVTSSIVTPSITSSASSTSKPYVEVAYGV